MSDAREQDWKTAAAAYWDKQATRWAQDPAQGRVEADLLMRMALSVCAPGSLVLDAGCGAGRLAIPLALAGRRVHAFDLSPEMIAKARAGASDAGLGDDTIELSAGDCEQIEADDGAYDAVVCRNVLDFLPRPGVALLEFGRVLRPGGRLLLSTLGARSPVKYELWRRFLPDAGLPQMFNHILPWEIEALLLEFGWRILDQRPSFAPSVAGQLNAYTEDAADRIADRLLLQAIATSWIFVADRPDEVRQNSGRFRARPDVLH